MLFHKESRPDPQRIATGIAALDAVGLAWRPGGQHVVLGTRQSGRTALLLEFAIRHIDLDPSHRVLLLTENGAKAVVQRLIRREALRLQHGVTSEFDSPLLFSAPRHHIAKIRIQALVERRLQLIPAPFGSTGIRFIPLPEPEDQTYGAPTLVVVDGYSVARTPLDRVREMIRCSWSEGQDVTHCDPPLVISTHARKGQRDWPNLGRWEYENLLVPADSTIFLQHVSGTGRTLYTHVGWANPERPQTVRLEIDEAGAISTR